MYVIIVIIAAYGLFLKIGGTLISLRNFVSCQSTKPRRVRSERGGVDGV